MALTDEWNDRFSKLVSFVRSTFFWVGIMKILSMRQPWAFLITQGSKNIESRAHRRDSSIHLFGGRSVKLDCGEHRVNQRAVPGP